MPWHSLKRNWPIVQTSTRARSIRIDRSEQLPRRNCSIGSMNRTSDHGGKRFESKMTDEPHLPRFLIRRGAWRGWMVWDRHTKGPAKYLGYPVVELPEDQAREIADELTKRYIAEG
jgi:hypothetical protein